MNWFFNIFHRKNTKNTTDNTEANMTTYRNDVYSDEIRVTSDERCGALRAVKNEKSCAMKSNFWKNAAMWLVAAGTVLGGAREAGAWAWAQAWADHTSQTFYVGDTPCFTWWFNGDGHDASDKEWSLDKGTRSWKSGSSYIYKESGTDGGNTQWETTGIQVTSSGTWYYSLFLGWGSNRSNGHYYNYGSGEWNEGSSSVITSSFTVNALNNPTAGTLTPSSTSITVNWTKGTSGDAKDTLVLRSTSSTKPTPANGTQYNTGDTVTLGGNEYKVVHRGGNTSATDSGLSSGTTYYYYFYAENWKYYSAGVSKSATTTAKPTISSPTATSIATNGATLGAKVTANGGAAVSLYGVYCGTSASPTSGGYTKSGTPTIGTAYSQSVTGLKPGTKYYYRGFASNAVGIVYTSDGTFTNKPMAPTITSNAATVSSIKFTVNNPNNNGAATTYKYVVGTSAGTAATAITAGTATNITGLLPNTDYYVVVTATAGGNSISVTNTIHTSSPGAGEIVDWLSTAASGAWVNASTFPWYYNTSAVNWKNVTDFGAQHVRINNNNQVEQTLSANTEVKSLTYGSSADTAHTLSGAYTLTVNGGLTNAAAATHTISSAVALGADTIATVSSSSGGLTLSGVVSGSGKSLTKQGSGTLTLSGANDYSGGTSVDAGTLDIKSASALGTGTATLEEGATLQLSPSSAITVANAIDMDGDATIYNSASANTLSGNVTGDGTVTVNAGANLTMSGVLSGDKGLTKTGTGTLTLSGANTYTGDTTINAGTLAITTTNALGDTGGKTTVNSSGTLAFQVPGAVMTSGTMTEPITLNGGTLYNATGVVTNNSPITLTANSVINVTKTTVLGGLISGSYGIEKKGTGTLYFTAADTFAGATTISAGTLCLSGSGSTAGTVAGNIAMSAGNLSFSKSGTWTYAKVISGTTTGYIQKTGTGTLNLSGANTVSADWQLTRGTLGIQNASALGSPKGILLSANAYGKTLNYTVDATVSCAITNSSSAKVTNTVASAKTVTYSGVVKGSGTGAIVKNGDGTLVMGGENTYSAATEVNAGTLKLTGTAASSDFTVAGGTLEAGAANRTVKSLTMTSGGIKASTANTFSSSGAANLTGGTIYFDASAWTKAGTTQSWTIFAGGAAATRAAAVDLNVTLATGTTADEYTVAASGNNVVVTWTKQQSAPAVANNTITSISTTSATLGATVTADGNSTITSYGVRCGTSSGPTGGGYSNSGAPTIGTAYTKSVTGLSANTLYYVRGFAVNGVGTGYATESSFRTTANAPSAPTGLTLAPTNTKMTISWTKGTSSAGTVVVIYTSDPATAPTVRTSYTAASTNYASATSGLGGKIVYVGEGTSVTVTNLSAGTQYYVRAYGYAGTGDDSSLLNSLAYSSAATKNGYTLVDEPAAQAGLTLGARAATSITLAVTRASGATHTLVVAYTNNTTKPADGKAYNASTTYGSGAGSASAGYVVYAGTDASTNLTVTGLAAGTRYRFVAYSYNRGSADATINYNTASAPVVEAYTLATAPSTAGTVTYNAHTVNSITWKYTRPSSDSAGVVVVMKEGGAPTWTPTNGAALPGANATFGGSGAAGSASAGYVVYAGTAGTASGGASLEVTGLKAGTQYYAIAYAYAGSATGTTYNYAAASSSANGYTLAAEPTTAPGLTVSARTTNTITLAYTMATTGNRLLIVGYSTDSNWTEPSDGAVSTSVTSGVLNYTSAGTLGVTKVIRSAVTANGSVVITNLNPATTYYFRAYGYNVSNSAAATANYYATYTAKNAATLASEPTGAPTLALSSQTTTSVTLTITKGTGGTNTLVAAHTANSFGTPSDGSAYAANTVYTNATVNLSPARTVYSANGTSVTVTGLTPGTAYYFKAYAYNGESANSSQNYRSTGSSVLTVYTQPNTPTLAASADGKTMVRLNMTKPSGTSSGMVLVYGGSAAPSGTPGAAGTALGGGTIVWKGTATTSGFEHVVAAGATHGYRLFAYAGSGTSTAYSAAASQSVSTGSISGGQVETFSYTNGTGISSTHWAQPDNGWSSTGWAAWDSSSSYIKIAQPSIDGKGLVSSSKLGQAGGNAVWFEGSNDTRVVRAYRAFDSAYTSGEVWFMYTVRTEFGCTNSGTAGDAANKSFGMQFMSTAGDSSKIFASVGAPKGYWAKLLGVDTSKDGSGLPSGSSVTAGTYEIKDYGHSSSKAHTIYGYIDLESNKVYVNGAYSGTVFTNMAKPTSWNVNGASISPASKAVAGVTLYTMGYVGNTYFDEIRVAGSWTQLMGAEATKPAAPTSFTVTRDGNEMIRGSVSAAESTILIVTNGTGTFTAPVDGTTYNVGSSAAGGTVVYKGGSKSDLEFVVPQGSTTYFAAYAYNGDKYSDAKASEPASIATGSHDSGIAVDTFSYTNATTPSAAWSGGQGFSGNWTAADSGTWYTYTTNTFEPSTVHIGTVVSNYMAPMGNALQLTGLGNTQKGTLKRTLSTSYGGANGKKMYVSFLMGYQYHGAKKWAGLELMNGSTEKVLFGKGYSETYWTTAGITVEGSGGGTGWADYSLNELGDNANPQNVYLVVGRVEWTGSSTANLAMKIYQAGLFDLPENEPSSWDATYNNASLTTIDGVKFNAGANEGNIGCVYFDSLRIGTNWDAIIGSVAPTNIGVVNTAVTNCYLGDSVQVAFWSEPKGIGQEAAFSVSYDSGSTWANTVNATWKSNNTAGTVSYWLSEPIQMTNTATSPEVRTKASVTGGGKTLDTTGAPVASGNRMKPYIKVNALTNPTVTSATGGARTATINWTKWNSRDVLIVRYQNSNDTVTKPTGGVSYAVGDTLGVGTVVYRGNGLTFTDTTVAFASNTYKYVLYSENYSYYSTGKSTNVTTTTTTETMPDINGNPNDWVGTPSPVKNSATFSMNEYIWTDKTNDERTDKTEHANGDLTEWRIKSDANYVYMLFRLQNLSALSNAHIVVGVDTRRNKNSADMNWLGDESGITMGDGYFGTNANIHYPERQFSVHYVSGTNTLQVEMYATNSSKWYAPPTVPSGQSKAWEAAGSTANNCIEVKINRADLDLTGAVTGRFTVATFLNNPIWSNDGTTTREISEGTCHAVDSVAIMPWNTGDKSINNDTNAAHSAWTEDLSDADLDFWVDVPFTATSLSAADTRPTKPIGCSPLDDTHSFASPTLSWSAVTDADLTGYFLEVATNANFEAAGVPASATENGGVVYRVNLPTNVTSYKISTSASNYWWRVRARDTAGQLSPYTIQSYTVAGKLDIDGPKATLVYVGTNVTGYLANGGNNDYARHLNNYGLATSVLDSECGSGHEFGFILRWEDSSGVYATNQARAWIHRENPTNFNGTYYNDDDDIYQIAKDDYPGEGKYAYNVVSSQGRVSPNWDLIAFDTVRKQSAGAPDAIVLTNASGATVRTVSWAWATNKLGTNELVGWTAEWGYDECFTIPQTMASGNSDPVITNYVASAFRLPKYDPDIEFFLTASAEDSCCVNDAGVEEWTPWPYGCNGNFDRTKTGSWSADYGLDAEHNTIDRSQSSGYCKDGPSPHRNVTTNQLIPILVRDNDVNPPTFSTNNWASAVVNGTNFFPALVVTTNVTQSVADKTWAGISDKIDYVEGVGQNVLYQIYDSDLYQHPLSFHFNVYDLFDESGGVKYGTTKEETIGGTKFTNSAFIAVNWTTNWDKFVLSKSVIEEPGDPGTILTWQWPRVDSDVVTALWGPVDEALVASEYGITNIIQLDAYDADNNRPGDQANARVAFGDIRLVDDDRTAPAISTYEALGSGTNKVTFGAVAEWTLTSSGSLSGHLDNVSASAVTGSDTLTFNTDGAVLKSGMNKTDYTQSKYYQFDVWATDGGSWRSQAIKFRTKTTKAGPTNFVLTVQKLGQHTVAKVPDSDLAAEAAETDGWSYTNGANWNTAQSAHQLSRAGAGSGSADFALVSPAVNLSGASTVKLAFSAKPFNVASGGSKLLKVQYSANGGSSWIDLTSYTLSAGADWSDKTVNVTASAALVNGVRFRLMCNTANTVGALVKGATLTRGNNGAEQVQATVSFAKDVSATTGDEVDTTLDFVVPLATAATGYTGETNRFRLYAYGAPSSGNIYIKNLSVQGIVSSPRGSEITDSDLRYGVWTNRLVAADGAKTGTDKTKSGMWVSAYTDAVAIVTSHHPSFEILNSSGTTLRDGFYSVMNEGAYGNGAQGTVELFLNTGPLGVLTNTEFAVGSDYRFNATVADFDTDRNNDWRTDSSNVTSRLYDDDTQAPMHAWTYNGPFGITIGDNVFGKGTDSGLTRTNTVTDHDLAEALGRDESAVMTFHLGFYDFSGWEATNITIGTTKIWENGQRKDSTVTFTKTNGAANSPGAEMAWTTTGAQFWSSYGSALGTAAATNTVYAGIVDLDSDRVDSTGKNIDSLAFDYKKVGTLVLADNDTAAPKWRDGDNGTFQRMLVLTNMPNATLDSAQHLTNYYRGASASSYVLGGNLADYNSTTAPTKTVTDGYLRSVDTTHQFAVVVDVWDKDSGLLRSLDSSVSSSNRTTKLGTSAFQVLNSYVAFRDGAGNNALQNYTTKSNWSVSIGSTKLATTNANTVFAWTNFTKANVTQLLPSGCESTNWSLRAVMRDADIDRSGDQLVFADNDVKLNIVDDDTAAPVTNAYAVLTNGTAVAIAKNGGTTSQYHNLTDGVLLSCYKTEPKKLTWQLGYQDASGWRITNLFFGATAANIKTTVLSGGSVASRGTPGTGFSRASGNTDDGTASSAAATVGWEISAADFYNQYKDAIASQKAVYTNVYVGITDLDDDRDGDPKALAPAQVARFRVYDDDTVNPVMNTTTYKYNRGIILTNLPTGATRANVTDTYIADAYALGGSAAAHATDTDLSARAFTITDGDLAAVTAAKRLAVLVDITDATSGLQRGTTQKTSAQTTLDGSVQFNNTYMYWANTAGTSLLNSYDGTGGNYNSTLSCTLSNSKKTTGNYATIFTWTDFPRAKISSFLPSGYGTAGKEFTNVVLKLQAYDADLEWNGDQRTYALTMQTLHVRDDDTTPPTAPSQLYKGSSSTKILIPQSATNRNTVFWTNNYNGSLIFAFKDAGASTDPVGTAEDDNGDTDSSVTGGVASGIKEYRFAPETEAISTNAGTKVEPYLKSGYHQFYTKSNNIYTVITNGWGNYQLFAVDADDDRDGDALAGPALKIPLGFDNVKPTSVATFSTTNDTDAAFDETSMIKLKWTAPSSGMGPDNTADGAPSIDAYSPWDTYKVYFTTYQSEHAQPSVTDQEVKDRTNGWASWTYVTATTNTATGAAVSYTDLASAGTTAFTLKDLEPGENFIFAIVGRDRAGNESATPKFAVGDTIKFMVTQGVVRAWSDLETDLNKAALGGAGTFVPRNKGNSRGSPALYWDAKLSNGRAGRAYSLVYRDGMGFSEGCDTLITNAAGTTGYGWGRIAGNSISNNYYAEPDGNALKLGRGMMRFYRATYAGREVKTDTVTPLASEEVYALHNVKLTQGRNFVALHGVPYTNTFRGVFGCDTNIWPSAASEGNATKVEFFDGLRGTATTAKETYWFCNDGKWYKSGGGTTDYSDWPGNAQPNFFTRGFAIVLPTANAAAFYNGETITVYERENGKLTGKTARVFDWAPVLQMPTNGGFSVTVNCGTHTTFGKMVVPTGVDTFVAFRAPRILHPRELQLPLVSGTSATKTGFVYNTTNPLEGDRLLIRAAAAKTDRAMGDDSPYGNEAGSDSPTEMYYDGTNWRWNKGSVNANNPIVSDNVYPIKPNDALIIRSLNGGVGNSWTWTYDPTTLYDAADRHFGE